MRICAFVNCGNSTYTIERWRQEKCRVHGDKHETGTCMCARPFTLFPFPVDSDGKMRWSKLINRKVHTKGGTSVKNWTPTRDSRVCSKHFIDGKPTETHPDPCLHLGYDTPAAVRVKRTYRSQPTPREPPAKVIRVSRPHSNKNTDQDNYVCHCECQINCQCTGCVVKQKTINVLKHENEQLREQLQAAKHAKVKSRVSTRVVDTSFLLKTNKRVKAYTVLPTKQAFEDLLAYLFPVADKMSYWKGSTKVVSKLRYFKKSPQKLGHRRKLKIKDELMMVLMKLRLALTNQLLSDIFGVSVCVCSQVFNTWIKMMAVELKPLVNWPDKQSIISSIPEQLREKFPQLRCTLDCTEIFIYRPRHLEIQAETWSDYKKHNTVKILIAITPNGMISFVSKAWGGRASDRHITRESGFLDLVDPNDTILADRGFTIQDDLLLRHAKLYIPPPSSGVEQQRKTDVLKTKTIANARIHVERAIGRIKWFKLLKNTLPISLVPLIDSIILVCAALSNLLLALA